MGPLYGNSRPFKLVNLGRKVLVKSDCIERTWISTDASCVYLHHHNTQTGDRLSKGFSLWFRNPEPLLTSNKTKASSCVSIKNCAPGNFPNVKLLKSDYLAKVRPRSGELADRVEQENPVPRLFGRLPRLLRRSLGALCQIDSVSEAKNANKQPDDIEQIALVICQKAQNIRSISG